MTEEDFSRVSAKIDGEKDFLRSIGEEIWKNPELAYQEKFAHGILTTALSKCGFDVQKHYVIPTAFKAEFASKTGDGPVIAVLLEYDALPEIGHGCGHNLIAEAGLAAALGIKAVMEVDPTLVGKLLVLGAPAEESGAGKVDLLKGGAFEGVDAAMMTHPCHYNTTCPPIQCMVEINVIFTGKETHAATSPWEGRNALDAAVAAYQNVALLRQHIKHTDKIHSIITKGGTVPNIIPAESRMELFVRSLTRGELWELVPRVMECLKSGASATGCNAEIVVDKDHCNENLISNKIMGDFYDTYAHKFGKYLINSTEYFLIKMCIIRETVEMAMFSSASEDETISDSEYFMDMEGLPDESFQTFLSTFPKISSEEKTAHWLLHQCDDTHDPNG